MEESFLWEVSPKPCKSFSLNIPNELFKENHSVV